MTQFAFNPDSSLKSPTQEELEAIDGDTIILSLVRGTDENGAPWWAFLGVKPSLYEEYHRRTHAKEMITPGDFGQIIEAGDGEQPPTDVMARMKSEHGWDDNYVQNLIVELREQKKAHFDAREKNRIDSIVEMLKKQQKPNA